jgi:hypothetical protein
MKTPTHEETAEKLIDENPCFYDATDFKESSVGFKRDEGIKAIAAALKEAEERTRESCAKAVCNLCRGGIAYDADTGLHISYGPDGELEPCNASAIRSRKPEK